MHVAVYKVDDVICDVVLTTPRIIDDGYYYWHDISNRGYSESEAWRLIGVKFDQGRFELPPLVPPRPPEVISDRQFFQALAIDEVITQEEALAAVSHGAIPAKMKEFIAVFEPKEQFAAKMLLSGAKEFQRHHPLVEFFGHAMGWDEAKTDQLWRQAAAL